jgi:UDP-N-acetylmuramyl pentapeptide phosphotransferase/UDP-N-acetylglucosamine-1-phosphate transferase
LLGIFDDKYNISPNKKILLQILILFLFFFFNKNLLIHEIRFNNLNIQLNYYLALLFTIFCLLCLINAFNYIDGINGIAISFYLYCSVFLFIKSKDIFIILLIFPSLFFLLQNYKEKIFLGNSGSLLLPFVLGIQTIYMHNHYKINANDITLLFFVPGADFIYLFIIRLLKYKNPFRADLNHLHHLLRNFFKKNYFTIIYYNMILFFPIALNLILKINFIITIILLFFLYYSLRAFLKP